MELIGNTLHVDSKFVDKELLTRISNELEVHIIDYLGKKKTTKLYEHSASGFEFPRIWGLAEFQKTPIKRKALNAGKELIIQKSCLELKKYQSDIILELEKSYLSKKLVDLCYSGCTLVLPCGSGKTYVGLGIIEKWKRKTIIVCPSRICVTQWIKVLTKLLLGIVIREYHGGDEFPIGDVIVCTIHAISIHIGKDPSKWINEFGIIIYDEIHMYASIVFSKAFDLFSPAYQIGLTATPDRSDAMDLLFDRKIGPILRCDKLFGIIPYKFDIDVLVVKPETGVKSIKAGKNERNKLIMGYTLSEKRVDYILPKIKEHLSKKEYAIIFCNYITEVDFLFKALSAKLDNAKIGKVYSNIGPDEVLETAEAADIILCTYSKGGVAFDATRFTVAIIWSTTRARITQAIGRITRWNEIDLDFNKKKRYVYDIIDKGNSSAYLQYKFPSSNMCMDKKRPIPGRKECYQSLGCRIIEEAASSIKPLKVDDLFNK